MTEVDARLEVFRGSGQQRRHNARTLAALAGNPGCARRAVLDAAGVDKERLSAHIGFPGRYGQSRFAITRGNAFEAQVMANGCAELLSLLRYRLALPIPEVGYHDLDNVGGNDSNEVRHAHTRSLLVRAAGAGDDAGTLFDHPLLRPDVGGRAVHLEPDLIAFRLHGRFHVVEIKSFPVIDDQADGAKVAAAAIQSAVYVTALRAMLGEHRVDPLIVSHDVVLVCPENFANRPVATLLDVRKQLTVLRRQLSRLARIDTLLDALPAGLTVDLRPDEHGLPTRSAAELVAVLDCIEARYAPECLTHCEMAFFCRDQARGDTAALGRAVREELGGVESVTTALGLARATQPPAAEQAEAAVLLRTAARLRTECVKEA